MTRYNDSRSEYESMDSPSRRKFLIRAGASALTFGTSALALPFLDRAAHAQCTQPPPPCTENCPTPLTPPGSPTDTPPSCTAVNNVDDGEWLIRGCCTDTVCGYNAAGINVSGVRHYCSEDGTIPWGTAETNPTGTPFPVRPDNASFCLTIYPVVSTLLSGGYDADLTGLFTQSNFNYGRDMLSCWHEVANVGGKYDASGACITAADAVAMQKYILNFRNKLGLTSPKFGAIECPAETSCSSDFGVGRCGPFMATAKNGGVVLDFYGQDLYHDNYSTPSGPLGAWDNAFGSGVSSATIAVCECNAENDSDRPKFYNDTAYWLWTQKNKGARSFLTFWKYSSDYGESGPWSTVTQPTIAALTAIAGGKYTNP